jgi:hypothetical protein
VGSWLATIRFPDGTTKYARYSTVVEAVLSGFYADADLTEPDPGVAAGSSVCRDCLVAQLTSGDDRR